MICAFPLFWLNPKDQPGYFRDQQIVFEGDGLWASPVECL